MNIVYLLIHKIRLEENTPPYYYIGSKYKWKGAGTYYSSSRHKIFKTAYVDDLIFTPIWTSADCSKEELLEKEKEFQIKHNVLRNHLFFNGNIANTTLFSLNEESLERRIEKFKQVAKTVGPEGIPNSVIWAKKAQQAIKEKYTPEELSVIGRERQEQLHSSGRKVKEVVHERMMSKMREVDENGKTGFQRAGEGLSKFLNSVCSVTGLRVAERRTYYGTKASRLELFGICFFSKKNAQQLFGISKEALRNVRKGWCSSETYEKIENFLGREYLSNYPLKIKNAGEIKEISICGEIFEGWLAVRETFKVTQWATDEYSRTGKPNKKFKKAIIDRYGDVKYYEYYPQQ